jgi:hypothetical protein
LQAHLTGIAFVYDPIVPISDGGYIPAEVIEVQRADNEAAAESAIKNFTAATDRAGISAEPLTLNASLAGAADQFARIARRFDLAIVGQGQPEATSMDQITFKIDNVMICWDGSRAAARAVADAIPVLGKSGGGRYRPASRPARTQGGRATHFRRRHRWSPTHCCRTPPTAPPISW